MFRNNIFGVCVGLTLLVAQASNQSAVLLDSVREYVLCFVFTSACRRRFGIFASPPPFFIMLSSVEESCYCSPGGRRRGRCGRGSSVVMKQLRRCSQMSHQWCTYIQPRVEPMCTQGAVPLWLSLGWQFRCQMGMVRGGNIRNMWQSC